MRLWKAHGLGNDYLVLESGEALNASLVQALCDRNRGPGSDGILEPSAMGAADFGVRIWNPDGSIAEKSGNGLRIFARWIADRTGTTRFTVFTGFDTVTCDVGAESIAIEMGAAKVAPAEVVDGTEVVPVDVGNPHAVVWLASALDLFPWRERGASLEVHPRFPNRTNVQFARVVHRRTAEARIWERGAGATLASGSSACAVAASGVATGRLEPGWVTVDMPGGALRVHVGPGGLLLEGPVERIGRFDLDPLWVASRALATDPTLL